MKRKGARSLRGSIAILTGASRGIGVHIARTLAREGVHLVLLARGEGVLTVADEARSHGVRAVAVQGDVTDGATRERLVAKASELGPPDILVNNAATIEYASFYRQPEEEVQALIETNLTAPLLLTRLVLPGMIERGRGNIVSLSSLAGKKGAPFEAVYSASKAGIVEWTSALRLELTGTGVNVSVVLPTYVSGEGLWAIHGVRAPRLAGSVTPEAVAMGVVRAVRTGRQEVIVRRPPTRLLLAVNALSPAIGNAIIRAMGVPDAHREIADRRGSSNSAGDAQS